jgi:hypothetical protein
VLGVSTV